MVLEMESGKNLETIKEGFLEAKLGEAQISCDKSLQVCEKDVVFGEGGSNVVGRQWCFDDFRAKGFENGEELSVGGNVPENKMDRGSLQCDAGGVNDSKEGDDKYSEKLGAKKIMPEVNEVKGEGEMQFPAQETKDSGHGICLFVEVFGPLNGVKQDEPNCEDRSGLGRSNCQVENVRDVDGLLLSDNGNVDPVVGESKLGAEVESACNSDLHSSLNVGNLVWVKTKTQLWWPGVICDPSCAGKDNAKSEKRNNILVKHFGNANSVWCCPSELKPFLENLECMSKLNKSRSFLGAIERAIGEFGRRVKVDMTCSCFLKGKGSQMVASESAPSKANPVIKEKTDAAGHFSASRFESADFLGSIRNLARCISVPSKIDLVITQNCLSAFYCSLGHLQLPSHQLRPAAEDKDRSRDGVESERKHADRIKRSRVDGIDSQKFVLASDGGRENGDPRSERKDEAGYRSRERRKSKYLSYPYVNGEGSNKDPGLSENETDSPNDGPSLGANADSESGQCEVVSPPVIKSGGKIKKKGSRKHIEVESKLSELQINNLSSTKILSDLHSAALVCVYPTASEQDFLRQFVSSFRKFAFLNQKADEDDHQESSPDIPNHQELPEASGNNLGSGGNPKRQGTKKKKVKSEGPAQSPAAISVSTTENVPQETGNVAAKTPKVRSKRKIKTEGTTEGELPDLNANTTNLSVEDMQVTGPAVCEGKLQPKRRKKEGVLASGFPQSVVDVNGDAMKFVPLPQSMQAAISQTNTDQSMNETATILLNSECTARPSEHIIGFSSPQNKDLSSPGVEPKPKKRKRRTKAQMLADANRASAIPDLNGNLAELNPLGKDPPGVANSVFPGLKPPPNKRKRKIGAPHAAPEINNGYSLKMKNHIEAVGGVLHLNFASGCPLPSKGQLVSTFSVFGPLKEAETQALNESSAQIVFAKSSDAGLAYRSLEKTNPFGASLASFRLNYLSSGSRIPENTNNLQVPRAFQPLDGRELQGGSSPLKPHNNGDARDLQSIKRNLDMMKSMLERAGDKLSPETKAKLENEIKGFMAKLSPVVGSSSS